MTQPRSDGELPEGETTEEGPKTPRVENRPAKRKGRKRLGPRWNPMSAVYGPSNVPEPPKIE